MFKNACLSTFFLLIFFAAHAQLLSPDDFLPHRLGEQFTPHHLLVKYVEHVAANSPNVEVMRYGATYEGRPQLLAFISTPANLARLEAIRTNNLRRTGMVDGAPDPNLDVAIIWLGYSVHGNEAAGSESSMAVLYELADPATTRTQAWLQNTLVIIDPSYNPDGYSRYTQWYRGISNAIPDPAPGSWEHDEPWPRGRVNHYLFDLNRDWAWQTQQESRNRMEQYNRWLPHIHVDLHEQGYNSPYYFAPAAKPYHPYITRWQRDFQTEIGQNNARYFDEQGWLYFTRQRFDLFYPSYGDTYPTYNGAIGMTYEQGGIGAGRAVITEAGDTLTLADRIAHHQTTSLATIEMASTNAQRLLDNFADYYREARNNPPGPYQTFIIKGDNARGRLQRFTELLDRNHIRYGTAPRATRLAAYDYASGQSTTVEVDDDDLIINARQPRGVLAQILLEPAAVLEDSITYDITAWSLIHAYGLEAYASAEPVEVRAGYELPSPRNNLTDMRRPYAYIAEWNSLPNARFLADLLQRGLVVRYAEVPFGIDGVDYPAGSLVITRADNRAHEERLASEVAQAAAAHGQSIAAVRTGFSDNGTDLGSGEMRVIERPRVALLGRDGTSANSFGQVWHYFEQELQYPVQIYPADDLPRLDLSNIDVLILPEGRYRIDERSGERLTGWIRGGGRLIAIASAIRSLEGVNGFGIRRKMTGTESEAGEESNGYGSAERRNISDIIAGAVFRVDVDNSHPLAFGLDDHYFSLKTNELSYAPLDDGWNVGALGDELLITGFAGYRAREQVKGTLVFGVENMGRGSVVYLVDNPLYRAFWENGKFLFGNAVFMDGR